MAGEQRQITVTASGIARMAGVGRAAVSNWRRRHANFPLPVGGTVVSPVFDAAEIEQWLQAQGKLQTVALDEQLWRRLESLTPAARIGDALCIAGACLLVDNGVARPPTPKKLLAALRSRSKRLAELAAELLPEEWSPELDEIVQATIQLGREQDPGTAFEYLHGQFAASTRALSGPDVTPQVVAEVMLALAGTGARILDSACGTGSILYVAAEQALRKGVALQCFAQETKPQYALITLLRLWFLHERANEAGIHGEPPIAYVGDSLLSDRFPDVAADVVVINPPFGIHEWGHDQLAYDPRWTFGMPPRTEPELAWVQHALAHLAPGKRAVLLMPPAAATRPAGRRIRGELVRRGALQAVIALPPGLLPPAAIGLHLWVLSRPEVAVAAAPRLLFVDTSASPATSIRDVVERAWKAYRSKRTVADEPGVFRSVAVVDVLDDEVDLTPRRYLPAASRTARAPEATMSLTDELSSVMDGLRVGLPRVRAEEGMSWTMARTAEIADLVRSGSLSIVRSAARSRAEKAVESPVLTGADVLSGGPPTGTAAKPASQTDRTQVQAGDVLIPVIARDVIARVATQVQMNVEIGPTVHAVRVDPEVLDPWFLAGVLSRRGNARIAGRVSTSMAGMLRIDVTRLAVPVLPIEVQRAYGDAFRRIAEFEMGLARALELGAELAREMADGLASGDLRPD